MKITKVSYQKTYSIGPYLTDRVGFEADIDTSNDKDLFPDTPESALSELRKLADEWHKANNPHLYQEIKIQEQMHEVPFRMPIIYPGNTPPVIEYEKGESTPGTYLSDIQSAATLEELKTFKTIAGSTGNEELYKAYNSRVKELVNG